MKYIILFLLANLICFSVSAQVFFKQRVYGNEQREKNVSSTVEVESTTQINKVKINKVEYGLYSTYTSEWKEQPLEFHRRTAKFYLRDEKKAITMGQGRKLMKDLGEKEIVRAIDKSKLGTIGGRSVQVVGYWVGFFGFGMAATSVGDSQVATRGLTILAAAGGVWYGGRQLVILSRTPIRNRLSEYNSRFENTEKNFYPSFKPSAITFKPVQISPFTPSLTPTIGLSWKL
ncbi:hypothetical protein ACE193_13505 [Bernardetia sp. OM2101]|uniref:hypothetical protein n=1 Tax=Bernardetia sp. OM2101 TaxID=3344876 RepID=UPI0035CFDC11